MPSLLFLFIFLPMALHALTPHYDVKLTIDSEARLLRGRESIRFEHRAGTMRWDKRSGLNVEKHRYATGNLTVADTAVEAVLSQGGKHVVDLEYTATATAGFRWLSKEPGLFTAFHCAAWMVCDSSPEERATLRLEIVTKDSSLRAVGPGVERKHWRDAESNGSLPRECRSPPSESSARTKSLRWNS